MRIMEYTGADIQQLIMEKLAGTINPADDALLTTLMQQDETIQQQFTQLQNQLSEATQHGFSVEADENAAWEQLRSGLRTPTAAKGRVIGLVKIATAAACILLATGAFYFYKSNRQPVAQHMVKTPATKQPESITLRLANGQVINLSGAGNKTIHAGNTTINNAGNALSYKAASTEVQEWNTLNIPSAGSYTLTLADGTVVMLNSQTQIRFPFSFPGTTREVYIDGEAFFTVSKDAAKPFIVHTPKTNIRVLGTRFNVNTYDPEKISTALVEGSVNIQTAGHAAVTLKPGNEAVFNNGFAVTGFDENETLAWIQGTYYFHNVSLQQIAKVLERWFAVQVQFKNNTLPGRTFSGVIFKKEALQVFLDNLHASDAVNAEIKDNIVTFW
jgi:ferric-dicitrate binding protein FerR (iron transport regulator)